MLDYGFNLHVTLLQMNFISDENENVGVQILVSLKEIFVLFDWCVYFIQLQKYNKK